jgi:hypothetical protein
MNCPAIDFDALATRNGEGRLNARSSFETRHTKGRPQNRTSKAFIRCRPLDSGPDARSPAEVTESLKRLKPKAHRAKQQIEPQRRPLDKVPDRC